MELNQQLSILRQKHGYSQARLAEALGVSRQAISRWETGAAIPSSENLIQLSRLYQIPLDIILCTQDIAPHEIVKPAASMEKSQEKKSSYPFKINRLLAICTVSVILIITVLVCSMLLSKHETATANISLETMDSVNVNELEEMEEAQFNTK